MLTRCKHDDYCCSYCQGDMFTAVIRQSGKTMQLLEMRKEMYHILQSTEMISTVNTQVCQPPLVSGGIG